MTDVLSEKLGVSRRQVVKNILYTWEQATERNREDGARWYLINQQACEEMANGTGVSLETAAAVVAHLSPRMHWSRNLIAAHQMLHDTPVTGGVMGRSIEGARRAIVAYQNGEDPFATLTGPKVSNFAQNLIGNTDAVTVDVWAARVALPDFERAELDRAMGLAGIYAALSECYRTAADKVGVSPSTMQATTWIVARNGRAN
jgi:hypothetical protein